MTSSASEGRARNADRKEQPGKSTPTDEDPKTPGYCPGCLRFHRDVVFPAGGRPDMCAGAREAGEEIMTPPLTRPFLAPIRRQSQHSDFAKAIMNTRMSTAMSASSSPTLSPVRDLPAGTGEHDSMVPRPLPDDHDHDHDHLHVPRPPIAASSLSWALHGGAIGAPEGVGLALSDTPMASTPSTAPSSPRM
jgi:hypothetical protein